MNPKDEVKESEVDGLIRFVNFLAENEVKLLCMDFDLTFLSVHTGGEFVPKNSCRPIFAALAQEAHRAGLKTCIVTFHLKPRLVQMGVGQALDCSPSDVVVKCPGNVKGPPNYWETGKVAYIKRAWKDIFVDEAFDLKKVFLIDDDQNNIRISHKNGSPALWFNPESNLTTFLDSIAVEDDDTLEKFAPVPAASEAYSSGTFTLDGKRSSSCSFM